MRRFNPRFGWLFCVMIDGHLERPRGTEMFSVTPRGSHACHSWWTEPVRSRSARASRFAVDSCRVVLVSMGLSTNQIDQSWMGLSTI